MKKDKPLISVVIPTYKRSDTLWKAINSVINQEYTNWELFVVDDNDKNTMFRKRNEKLMKRYSDDPRINYLKHRRNKGGSAARNTGIKKSSGKYIALLDDDDYWLPEKLSLQQKKIKKLSKEWGGVYTQKIIEKENDFKEVLYKKRGDLTEEILLMEAFISTSSLLLKDTVFKNIGYFDENFQRHQDYEFLLRFFRQYKLDVLEEPLVVQGGLPTQLKASTIEKAKIRYFKKFEEDIKRLSLKTQKKIYSRHYFILSIFYLREYNMVDGFRNFIKSVKNNPFFIFPLFLFCKRFLSKWV